MDDELNSRLYAREANTIRKPHLKKIHRAQEVDTVEDELKFRERAWNGGNDVDQNHDLTPLAEGCFSFSAWFPKAPASLGSNCVDMTASL